jgi:hypothetical protein
MRLVESLPAGLVLAVLAAGWAGRAQGWSLFHPFGGDETEAKSARPAAKPATRPAAKPANSPGWTASKSATTHTFGSSSNKLGFLNSKPNTVFGSSGSQSVGSSSKLKSSGKSSFWSSLNPFHHEAPKKTKDMKDFVGGERP